jgi:hypothetical protein
MFDDALILECPAPALAPSGRRADLAEPEATGRVPRLSRLVALAWHLEQLVRTQAVPSYAELARLGHVTRARMSQIMNLLQLAPDIQEEILFWPPTCQGRDPIGMRRVQPITLVLSWKKQRRLWQALKKKVGRKLSQRLT